VASVESPSEEQWNHHSFGVPRCHNAMGNGSEGGWVEVQESGEGRHPSASGNARGNVEYRLIRLWVAGSMR